MTNEADATPQIIDLGAPIVSVNADKLVALHALIDGEDSECRRMSARGVHIEPLPGGGVVMVATDGICLGAYIDRDGSTARPTTIRLPGKARRQSFFSKIVRVYDRRIDNDALIAEGIGEGEQHTWRGFVREAEPGFPEWRRVFTRPVFDTPEQPSFDPRQIGRFAKISRSVQLHYFKADQPAIVDIGDQDFIGAIMPVKGREAAWLTAGSVILPAWITDHDNHDAQQSQGDA